MPRIVASCLSAPKWGGRRRDRTATHKLGAPLLLSASMAWLIQSSACLAFTRSTALFFAYLGVEFCGGGLGILVEIDLAGLLSYFV